MKMLASVVIFATLLSQATAAEPSRRSPQVGDIYEIRVTRETSGQGNSSSGKSTSKNMIVERVVEVRADGLVLEYDLPKDAAARPQNRQWQFPALIFKSRDGSAKLANRSALEARIDTWLKEAKLDRASCGRWIFTWSAFRIECDPESVIKTLEVFDLAVPGLSEGTPYELPEARKPALLTKKSEGPHGATYVGELQPDPDFVRRSRAETDVIVGEITQKPVTFDEALRARANDTVSGTIAITLDADRAGNVWRRTKIANVEIKRGDSRPEIESIKEVTERKKVLAP